MISKPHYHLATGRESKNRGNHYLCQNKGKDKRFCCCLEPAYDAEGNKLQS